MEVKMEITFTISSSIVLHAVFNSLFNFPFNSLRKAHNSQQAELAKVESMFNEKEGSLGERPSMLFGIICRSFLMLLQMVLQIRRSLRTFLCGSLQFRR